MSVRFAARSLTCFKFRFVSSPQLGTQGVLLLPHYLTEVSQQGLAN